MDRVPDGIWLVHCGKKHLNKAIRRKQNAMGPVGSEVSREANVPNNRNDRYLLMRLAHRNVLIDRLR
jgi:hypothetical protein